MRWRLVAHLRASRTDLPRSIPDDSQRWPGRRCGAVAQPRSSTNLALAMPSSSPTRRAGQHPGRSRYAGDGDAGGGATCLSHGFSVPRQLGIGIPPSKQEMIFERFRARGFHLDHEKIRRHRSGSDDRRPTCVVDGRQDLGRERAGPRKYVRVHGEVRPPAERSRAALAAGRPLARVAGAHRR